MSAGRPPGAPELGLLAKSGTLGFLGMVANAVLGFAVVFVIGRGMQAHGAGLLFEAAAIFTILENASELGADTGLLRILPAYRVRGRTQDLRHLVEVALVPSGVAASVCAMALWLLAPQLSHVFMHGDHRGIGISEIRALAPFLPLATVMTVASAATRGLGTMKPYVLVQNVGVPMLRLILVLVAFVVGLGGTAVAVAWGAPVAVGFAAAIAVAAALVSGERRRQPTLFPAELRATLASEFWRFAAPRGLAGVFQITVIWIDILLVGTYRSAGQAGIYTVASRYVLAGTFALQAVGIAIAPQVSRLFAGGQHDKARSVFQSSTWWIILVSWPVFFMLATFAPFFMGLFGTEFRAGSTALTILALGMLVLTGTGSNGVVLLMTGRSWWSLSIAAASVAVNVGLNLILIPRMGIDGAAVSWAATTLLNNGVTAAVLWKLSDLKAFGSGYGVAVGATACFALAGLLARELLGPGPMGLALAAVGGAIGYGAIAWKARRQLELSAFRGLAKLRLTG